MEKSWLEGNSEGLTFNFLSEDESEAVLNELSERMKDVVFAKSRDIVKDYMTKLGETPIYGEDTLHFRYELTFVGNDIFQILARRKRNENKQ
jgi:hypothetical protein